MKEKLRKFMIGRYGADQFSQFLSVFSLVLMILSIIIRNNIPFILALLMLVYCYFRIFSKSHGKRYHENEIYMKYKNRVTGYFKSIKSRAADRKTHHIYKCSSCSQKIRVPKGKGRIEITCPKCGGKFIKNS